MNRTSPDGLSGTVFRLSDLDRKPVPLVRFRPVYPIQARMRGQEGAVVLEFTVDAEGKTRDIEIRFSQPGNLFDSSAIRAVKRWQFKPGMKNGRAVAVRVRQKLTFTLE